MQNRFDAFSYETECKQSNDRRYIKHAANRRYDRRNGVKYGSTIFPSNSPMKLSRTLGSQDKQNISDNQKAIDLIQSTYDSCYRITQLKVTSSFCILALLSAFPKLPLEFQPCPVCTEKYWDQASKCSHLRAYTVPLRKSTIRTA